MHLEMRQFVRVLAHIVLQKEPIQPYVGHMLFLIWMQGNMMSVLRQHDFLQAPDINRMRNGIRYLPISMMAHDHAQERY